MKAGSSRLTGSMRNSFVILLGIIFASIPFLFTAFGSVSRAEAFVSNSPYPIGFWCNPYTESFSEGGYYTPVIGGAGCVYIAKDVPRTSQYFMGATYRGVMGSSTLLTGGNFMYGDQSYQVEYFPANMQQGEDLVTALYDPNPNWDRFFTQGDILPPNPGYGFIKWKWGVAPEPPPSPACTENCNSNVLFLPGVEASRLYKPSASNSDNKLWEPLSDVDVQYLFLNPDGSSLNNNIFVKKNDVLDEVPVVGTNIYKSFITQMDGMRESGVIENWEPIPYDWRLSIDDILNYGHEIDGRIYYSGSNRATSTPFIIQQLKSLAATSRTGKVTIIAHSNGGLVAKALVSKLGDTEASALIDKMIFIGVPQTGTPEAIAALLHGEKQGIAPVVHTAVARQFAQNAPMAYQLVPSPSYFSGPGGSVETPPVTFTSSDATKLFTDLYGSTINSHSELAQFITGVEGRNAPSVTNLTYPTKGSSTLLANADTLHNTSDVWTPPASIKLYQIAGWGNETISGISYSKGGFFHCLFTDPCLDYDPVLTIDGDGTVVVPSAFASVSGNSNIKNIWLDLAKFNQDHPLTTLVSRQEHSNMLEVPEVGELVGELILSDGNLALPTYLSLTEPPSDSIKRLRFSLHSPLSLKLLDSYGNSLRVSTSGSIENTIPGADYGEIGDIKYASVPANIPVTLKLNGQASGGFALKIDQTQGDTIVSSTKFVDVPSSTSTIATMMFADGTVAHAGPLSVDSDGNGSVDFTLSPQINGETVLKYKWSGFSQPINDTAYQPSLVASIFKAGSTVPVKFQLKKFDGLVTQANAMPVWLTPQKGIQLSAIANEPIYTDVASTDAAFKWDPIAQQYVYNWSTKGLTAGYWYKISARLDDGTIYSVVVGLK